jgi:hypothetical protein
MNELLIDGLAGAGYLLVLLGLAFVVVYLPQWAAGLHD